MDRVDAMRAFVSVVIEGSFSNAATAMQISPQLVSKYVSKLEERLDVRLLNRTTRKVSLTEAGTHYFQHAQQILSSIDEMESQLGGLQQSPKGTLRISAPVSFALKHMARLVTDFQLHYPSVTVDLQLNDRKVDIVDEGFDIALRIGRLKSSSLIAKRVAPIRIILCASPDYLKKHGVPKQPEDLKDHRYLHYSYIEMDGKENDIFQWLKTKNSKSVGDFQSNNGDVLVDAAIAGAGLVLQPTFIASEAVRSGKLNVVLPEFELDPMGLYVVYAHRKLLPNKVRCFIDFIEGYYGVPPYWDESID
ncbi:LysR family transcriptional regulator [Psychrosphaera sp. B3R10]|uniref:LysR family transcriptional regulator n=1 Tax=unclassified Psychrosphaera TaxID=2641570 RepID=UPI001C088C66|nr:MULTISPECIES: LysR family transcriptional regulator [unclassified Psychrosphaera]MBU2880373.1 LysR family transcriptional regulator [Psychrosphaera sp. I2R16]MBU2987812.1 LysR family transcriptional regulator [Psychrosphaera sp. B3R10]MDO6720678.1 LysR substrate-binding domain-containing protein [Psychrosphaera sp. 1_MG-2023]